MAPPTSHPESRRLEARAAGELAPHEAEALDAHLATCARCRSEVEGWTTLFSELEVLPRETPSAEFGARVMARLDVEAIRQSAAPLPLGARLWERFWDPFHAALRRVRGGGHAAGRRHLTPSGIQDFLDGALALRTRTRVEAHLATCRSCTEEVRSWSSLFDAMAEIPHLSPRPGFADRVMERVPVEAVATAAAASQAPGVLATAEERFLVPAGRGLKLVARGASKLVPTTRRGWVLATALMAAPGIGVVALLATIILNPLFTLGDLLTFASWRLFDAGAALWGSLVVTLSNAPILRTALDLVSGGQSGAALWGVTALVATLILTSSYVVYQNLIAPSSTGETHVQPRS